MLLVGVGETTETVEEYGACQGAHNKELYVQVHQCVSDCPCTHMIAYLNCSSIASIFGKAILQL